MQQNKNVEQKILDAAYATFIEKGYDGAKMRDIAARAEINISMLHYYYRSKDNLFDIAFSRAFDALYGRILEVLASKKDIREKIEAIVDIYINTLTDNPLLPTFIIGEITRNDITDTEGRQRYARYRNQLYEAMFIFGSQINHEAEIGNIRQINIKTFFMDIESVCMYPFLTRGFWQRAFDIDDEDFNEMMRAKKEEFIKSIFQQLKK